LNALAILKIQVHRDRDKEFADNQRFALATTIEVYLCNPQSLRRAGRKLPLRKVRCWARSGHSVTTA
jgi:hypothetical protein